MRVLVLEGNSKDASALRRALEDRFEVDVAATLEEGLRNIGDAASAPDVIIGDLNLTDPHGTEALATLKELAPTTPVVISTNQVRSTTSGQTEACDSRIGRQKDDGFSLLRAVLRQTSVVHETIARHKSEILQEIDIVAERAATQAVDQAIEQLVVRLGLDDKEGMKMAIRLARGWDAAKGRFVSAIATGIASAMLLALGAGIVAVLRNQGSK